jgi:hypothetical protein
VSSNKNKIWVKILLGSAVFVVSTWVSAYFSMQSANAQSFGFGTVTASTASWYKTTGTSDIYYRDGNVGIGIDTPGAPLEIRANALGSASESIATYKVSDDSTAKLEIMNATEGDGVFIPYIRGTGSSDKIPLYISGVATTDTGTAPAVMINGRLASTTLATRPVLQISNLSTILMTILANGNVGIGTATPERNLDINGNLMIRQGWRAIQIKGAGNNPHEYGMLAGCLGGGNPCPTSREGGFGLWDETAGQYRLAISNSGNIGIGTIDPTSKLEVNGQIEGGFGAMTTGGTLNWNDASNARSGSGYSLLMGNASNGPGPSVYFHPFSFEYSSKDGTGNMTQFAIPYGVSGEGSLYMRSRYSGTWTAWSQILSEDENGRVGINRASPSQALHVGGNIAATGWIGAGCEGGCNDSGGYALLYDNGNIQASGNLTLGSVTLYRISSNGCSGKGTLTTNSTCSTAVSSSDEGTYYYYACNGTADSSTSPVSCANTDTGLRVK